MTAIVSTAAFLIEIIAPSLFKWTLLLQPSAVPLKVCIIIIHSHIIYEREYSIVSGISHLCVTNCILNLLHNPIIISLARIKIKHIFICNKHSQSPCPQQWNVCHAVIVKISFFIFLYPNWLYLKNWTILYFSWNNLTHHKIYTKSICAHLFISVQTKRKLQIKICI